MIGFYRKPFLILLQKNFRNVSGVPNYVSPLYDDVFDHQGNGVPTTGIEGHQRRPLYVKEFTLFQNKGQALHAVVIAYKPQHQAGGRLHEYRFFAGRFVKHALNINDP